eukprot:scaffold50979_cov61-Phaeocystis_antarctica.AAC.4
MSGALHDGKAPDAHERLQPMKLLPHSLGEAAQALHRLKEKRFVVAVATSIDDLLECIIGQRVEPVRVEGHGPRENRHETRKQGTKKAATKALVRRTQLAVWKSGRRRAQGG